MGEEGRPGDHPLLAFGRARRAQADAYVRWDGQRRGRAMPGLDALPAGDPARTGALRIALHPDAGPTGRDVAVGPADTALRDVVRQRSAQIRAAAGPFGFSAEIPLADGTARCLGLLLPYADATGGVAAVELVFDVHLTPEPADLADGVAAAAAAAYAPPAAPVPSPWQGAAKPPAPLPAPSPADRLAAARTWAALAASSHGRRAECLAAALGAAYGLLVAIRADAAVRAALAGDVADERLADHLVVAVFGAGPGGEERAALAGTLVHADRLGLGPDQLGPLLGRYPGGHVAFGAAGRDVRAGIQDDAHAGAEAFTLEPLDTGLLRALAWRGIAPAPRAGACRAAA